MGKWLSVPDEFALETSEPPCAFRWGCVLFTQFQAIIIMRAVALVVAPFLAGILVPTTDEHLVGGGIKVLDDLQVKAKKEDAERAYVYAKYWHL